MVNGVDREDLKAALRKKFGSLQSFERAYGLPRNSVSATLRRPHEAGEVAIATALGRRAASLWPGRYHRNGQRKRPQPAANYGRTAC